MKPTYLEMSAFGPFAGQEVLPLGKLVSEGVFLIHGATGAGKTSIFDAISFALFGSASGETRPADSLRSDFADEGTPTYVILEFTHAGKNYKIERRPAYRKRKQRGEGFTESKAEAVLSLPDGSVVTGYQNVTGKVEELLCLDLKQFKQISMLAQGEFLRLLTVESRERGEIFRKVFHTGEIGRIGVKLKERMLKVKRICEDTDNSIMQYYMGIDCPEREEYQKIMLPWKKAPDINKAGDFPALLVRMLSEDQAEYEVRRSELEETEQELSKYTVAEAKIGELREKKAELAALEEEEKGQEEAERQNEADKRRLFFAKKAVSFVRPQREAYQAAKKEKEELFAAIREKEGQIEKLKEQEENVILMYHKAQAEKGGLEELMTKTESARRELSSLKERGQMTRESEEKEALLQQEKERGEALKKQVSEFEQKIQGCRESTERLVEIYREGTALEKEEREQKQKLKQLAEQKERFLSYDKIRSNYERLTGLIEEKSAIFRQQEKELESAQERYLKGQAGMLADHLKDGGPCPVCGATEHPHPARREDAVPSREELEKLRQESRVLQEEIGKLGREAAEEKSTMKLLEEYFAAAGQAPRGFGQDVPVKRRTSLAEYEQEEAAGQAHLQEVQTKIEVLLEEQQRCIEAKDSLPKLEEGAKAKRAEEERQKDTVQRLNTELLSLADSIKRLDFSISAVSEEEAAEKLEALQEEYEKKKDGIALAEKEYHDWDKKTQGEEAVLMQLSSQKSVRTMREENERENYLRALKDAGFDSEADFEQSVLSEPEIEKLEEKTTEFETKLLRQKERKKLLMQEISTNALLDEEVVKKRLEELKEQKKKKDSVLKRLYNRMEINEKVRRQTERLLRIAGQMHREYVSLAALSDVANGEMVGKERLPFEQYVQAFYFEQVIYEANLRLKQMSGGRYALLRKKEADNKRSVTGLDLEIMDYYTGKTRSVKSLSGGESFKAALCLALGLSDVIGQYAGGIAVETLFIDEGFGSLDKDSLEQAVGLLHSLAGGHRLVGIISHVEELKDCIERKVLLTKSTQGSEIHC